MANSLLDIRAQQYGYNIMQVAQQKYSKLFPLVYKKPGVNGKTFFQDRVGQWSMTAKAGLNAVTPENDPNFSRRMAYIETLHDARLLDRSVDLQVLADTKSPMTMSAGSAIGRAIDSLIITQLLGTAYYGETGSSSASITQSIAAGATGLTFAKVLEAKRTLDEADVDTEGRVMICSPQGLEDLLNTAQATSSDYAAVKALVKGEIDSWMGFKWVTSTLLPLSSTTRSCIAFQSYGLVYGYTEMPLVRTSERSDRSFSHQIYYEINHGAVRLEEERVVQVDITEA